MDKIIAAAAQLHGILGNKEYNFNKMKELARKVKEERFADLVLFPETALTGCCVDSLEEALSIGEPIDGPYVKKMQALSAELDIDIAFGMIEKCGKIAYNTLVLCEPDGNFGYYHKIHQPYVGIDRFAKKGDRHVVMDTRFGKIGLCICYDVRFPEMARMEALDGARLILNPSYMSGEGSARVMECCPKARALENRVFFMLCNTVGVEGGAEHHGGSMIIDITGKILDQAGKHEEIISALIDLSEADCKEIISIPGEYEVHFFDDRVPEVYGRILGR